MPSQGCYYSACPVDDICDGNIFCGRTLIEIVDPCMNPFEVAANDDTVAWPYEYGDDLSVTISDITIEPTERECKNIEWSCSVDPIPEGGEGCDICADANFDAETQTYTWRSADKDVCPPGDWPVCWTGCVGDPTLAEP